MYGLLPFGGSRVLRKSIHCFFVRCSWLFPRELSIRLFPGVVSLSSLSALLLPSVLAGAWLGCALLPVLLRKFPERGMFRSPLRVVAFFVFLCSRMHVGLRFIGPAVSTSSGVGYIATSVLPG